MGDYTKKGVKIGTCGEAYYSTLKMLEEVQRIDSYDSEINYYLEPKNECSFAFPFPEYDGKGIGEISNFHEGQRAEYMIFLPNEIHTFHSEIVFHTHPRGAEGLNIFVDCPNADQTKTRTSTRSFFKKTNPFRIVNQKYYKNTLHVVVECPYCQAQNILEHEEAIIAHDYLIKESVSFANYAKCENDESIKKDYLKKSQNYKIVAERLLETYKVKV